MRRTILATLALVPLGIGCALTYAAATSTPCAADDDRHDRDHARAREALLAGEVVPLETIIAGAQSRSGGTVIDVEIEDESDEHHHRREMGSDWSGFTYEIKLLLPNGQLVKQEYDARTGALLREKRRR